MHKIHTQNLVNLYLDKTQAATTVCGPPFYHINKHLSREKNEKNTQNPFLNFVYSAYLLFRWSMFCQLECVPFALIIERIFDLIFH